MLEEWIGREPQLHLVWAGEGDVRAVLLTGLTHAATVRSERLAAVVGGAVVAIDLASLATLPLAQGVDRVRQFLDRADGALPLLVADDLAAPFAALVVERLDRRPAETVLIAGHRAAAWQHGATPIPAPSPTLDGTHLLRLWHFLRDLHVDADDAEEIPDVAALNATFLEAAEQPAAFADFWAALLSSPMPGWRSVAAIGDLRAAEGGSVRFPANPPASVQRRMVATPRGVMHVRLSHGEGRPMLLLHHGPGATPVINDVIAAFDRPTIAPDFLGCGRSDLIDAPVDIATLADDMIALLDAMAIDTIDIFGTHTGAFVALEMAVQAPQRVARVILEGFTPPVTVDPDAIMSAYPTLSPVHTGTHLAEAWSLRRDMFRFAPFFAPTRAAQRRITAADAPFLHRWTMTLLRGAPTFRHVMRAAFAYDGGAALRRLTRPALICAGPEDSLHAGLAASRAFASDHVTIRETPATLWHPGQPSTAIAETVAIYRDFLDG